MDIFSIASELTSFIRRVVRDELAQIEQEKEQQQQEVEDSQAEFMADYYRYGKDE